MPVGSGRKGTPQIKDEVNEVHAKPLCPRSTGDKANLEERRNMQIRKTMFLIIVALLLIMVIAAPAMAAKPSAPPGKTITGGSFWAGSTTGSYAYSWIATHPIYYPEEKEGVSPPTAAGEFGNTYGRNIRELSFDEMQASNVTLQGTVTMRDIGPWEETSYFEVGLGGSLNSWHQHFGSLDGSVYVIFLANNQGGYNIHVQDYATHYPGSGAVYSTMGTPGDDPVPPATFHFVVRFDLDNRLAYLTVDGVSVDPVSFGKTILAPDGVMTEEVFDVPIGVFAGMVSTDTDNTGRVSMSALKVKM
ncbi:MAG: hypothetical protein JW732_09920 [Dehalococcoidia bacterium]|nr:hypothetical protein [Dehalococcoidia bacterium]